jgi:hypothetical protein
MRAEDLAGLKFGRLTGVVRVENKGRQTRWLWTCDCGQKKVVAADKVKSGHTISCGCYFPEVCLKHGHTYVNGKQTRTYKAWANMKSRVQGKTERSRKSYLLKGITVCDRWKQFEGFLADMGECPPGLTLDREDNDGNYEKDNCRWVPAAIQNRNKSDTILVDYRGSQLALVDACAAAGVLYDTAMKRIRRGMTPELALQPQ